MTPTRLVLSFLAAALLGAAGGFVWFCWVLDAVDRAEERQGWDE